MIRRLGRFEIQAEIGRGGFGHVYRAYDPVMKRPVAIKVLTATEDVNSLNRFINEATAAGNLKHENIVTVHEFGEEGNVHFLVMEFLDGEDLQHVIKKNLPLTLYQKVRIMDQVADGLFCAHRNGVLHRDVKPANIMVLKEGGVKIMDFGIARLTRDTSTRLTQQGYLIGTVVYMAPELFSSVEFEVDAMCDIWSYGVIFYELLAGKNPFQTGNMQSEMFRILNQDAPALPREVCTPELQSVISRLLSRSRDVRYQSLEDTRFDLQPILKDLEKTEADRLRAEAQQLLAEEKYEEALEAARKVRRIDPQDRLARKFFDLAQQGIAKEKVRPRIDDLVRRAYAAADQRRFQEGIDLLEEARKLDTSNQTIITRIQDLRNQKARLEDAARLYGEAERAFQDNRLTAAFEHISEAVELDPNNDQALKLRSNVQRKIDEREADRAVEAETRRARGLMAIDDLDGALETLKAADARYPRRAAIRDLMAKISADIVKRDRRREFSRRLESAKELVRKSGFEDAVRELDSLLVAFPNEPEAIELLNYARQELRNQQRAAEIRRALDSSAELSRAQRYADAVRVLEDALRKYSDDAQLSRALRTAQAELQAFERQRALQAGLQRCAGLRKSGKLQDALDLIAQLRADNPGNPTLLDLENEVRQEKQRADRAAAIRGAIGQADGLLRASDIDAAVNLLDTAVATLGADTDLIEALNKAKAAQTARREQQFIESEISSARCFEDLGNIDTALETIEDALAKLPKAARLIAERKRLIAKREEAQRLLQVSAKASELKQAIDRKDWREFDQKFNDATRIFDAKDFALLQEEARRQKNEHINQLVREARDILGRGRIEEAEQFATEKLLEYRDAPEVISFANEIAAERARQQKEKAEESQRAQFIADCLRAVRDREQSGDFAGALAALEQALNRYNSEPQLVDARNRITGQIARQRYAQMMSQVQSALDKAHWAEALPQIEQALRDYPNDPALVAAQAKAVSQRRSFLEGAASAIRGLLGEDRLDEARSLFNQHLARHQDQAVVQAVAGELAAAEAATAAEQQKRAFVSDMLNQAEACEKKGDCAKAMTALRAGLAKYPGDPQLSEALTRVQKKVDQDARERALAAKLEPIRKDIDRKKWEEPLKRLQELRLAFPDNPPQLVELEQQARKLREREMQPLVEKATSCLKLGKPDEAEKILNRQLAPFATEPSVIELAQAIKDSRERENLLQTARDHTAARRFDDAETAINRFAARFPRDPDEALLRASLLAAREQDRKEKIYKTGRAEADQLLRNRKYQEAIDRLEYLLTQFPGDRQLLQDLDAIKTRPAPVKEPPRKEEGEPKPAPLAKPVSPKLVPPKAGPSKVPLILVGAGVGLAAIIGGIVIGLPSSFEVKPGDMHFAYQPGTSLAPQKITAKGMSYVPLPQPNADWLKVTRGNSSGDKAEFLVQVLPEGLAPREYTTDLLFPKEKSVHVVLVVNGAANGSGTGGTSTQTQQVKPLRVQPTSVTVTDASGRPHPQRIVVTGSNIPEPRPSAGWITYTRRNISADEAEFMVQPVTAGLHAGPVQGELIFSPEVKVDVRATVSAQQQGSEQRTERPRVEPGALSFDTKGSLQQTLRVTGSNIPDPRAKDGWVKVSRRNTGQGRADFTVQVLPNGLSGVNRSELTFAPDVVVPITFTVDKVITQPPPAKEVDVQPAELKFTWNRPGAPPQAQSIAVTNGADLPDPNHKPWNSFTRANSGTTANFQVQINPQGLDGDSYDDDLVFGQKKVHIRLTIIDSEQKLPPPPPYQDLRWSGALEPGRDIVIKEDRVLAGGGKVDKRMPRATGSIDTSILPAGIQVVEEPSQGNNFKLKLRNNGAAPVYSIPIKWVKKP